MNVRVLAAEFLGTFALLFVGIGAIAADVHTGFKVGLVGIALAHGLAIATFVSALGPVSGAHFNPAVTLALFVRKHIRASQAAAYIAAQILGALAGTAAIRAVHDPAAIANSNLGQCVTVDALLPAQAIGLEAILTFFLVSVIYGAAVDRRAPKVGGLYIGLAVVMGIFAAGPLTGAAMNPARWFGPAALAGNWSQAGIYLVGPLLGGLAAGILYPFLFQSNPEQPA